MFIKVEKERLFKSHANRFESHVHKSYKRNLFRSHANHLESCEFLVLAAEACSGPLETGLSAELWVTHERRLGGQAEWDSAFGTLNPFLKEYKHV